MHILFVDAGNYCRSPAAETVARTVLARLGRSDVTVASAGLKDKHAGQPPDPRTVSACAARGYRLDGFLCREIGAADFARAGLILAMDRDNLAQLEARKPAGSPARIRLFLDGREVPDPYFGGEDGFVTMMDEIEGGVARLVEDLRRP
jgi:protein-tyrosine phosphatase